MRNDLLELLDRALAAGLKMEARGDKLVVSGPKRAVAIAQELGRHKAEVLAALAAPATPPPPAPRSTHQGVYTVDPQFYPFTEGSPATVLLNGRKYSVAVYLRMWFFRLVPEAGWTCASTGTAAMIEEQLANQQLQKKTT